ncbi:MAG: DUF4280 domain-containing protein [Oscillospiraceae bacterium]|nr:DUF4280 domain-containing protein [Oscillospiraceae bacterium]
MANPAVQTAVCTCSFGAVPMLLPVTSQQTVQMLSQLSATIMDNKPATFGMCSSLGNPTVAAATAAAMGALTPMPCVPATPAPWTPGVSTILICGNPLLNNTSTLQCMYGGVIQITATPAVNIQVP